MSMYRGTTNFSREQLVFAVEAVMAGAMDRIEAALPPTVSYEDYKANASHCEHLAHGAKSVVAITLPILWAQLNNDGMGVGEFPEWEAFDKIVDQYVRDVTHPEAPQVPVPDFRELAEKFVDREFANYLGTRELEPGERRMNVYYTAGFNAKIIVGPDEDPEDVAININIPEDQTSEYASGTFDIVSVE